MKNYILISFSILLACIQCSKATCDLDLGFILDESGSIRSTDFRKQIDFVKSIANQFNVGPYNTLISLITFSDHARLHFKFRDYYGYDNNGLNSYLSSISQKGGGTDTDEALDLARTSMYTTNSGERYNRPNVLIVITDGRSQSGQTTLQNAAQKLRDAGVNVLAVGVGYNINRQELQIISSSSSNVFSVSSANYLTSIIQKIKESSCTAVTCSYYDCYYANWGSWSRTCGTATRQRQYHYRTLRTKSQIGGCAGLKTTCQSVETETKTLISCPVYSPVRCNFKTCYYYGWSSWSATCGSVTRTRNRYYQTDSMAMVNEAKDCDDIQTYPKTCDTQQKQTKTLTKCPIRCLNKNCVYYGWSSWSATCGSVTRTRNRYYQTDSMAMVNEAKDCDNIQSYPKTCDTQQTHTKTLTKCPIRCLSKNCVYYGWSSWSATCGNGVTRKRRYRYSSSNYVTVQDQSECSKYKSQCESDETQTKNLSKCPVRCDYKSCSYYRWSSWSATCGNVTRTRNRYSQTNSVTYVKEAKDCDNYPKTCDSPQKQTKTLAKCPIRCLNKNCVYYGWSSWSATCGNGVSRKRRYRYSSSNYVTVQDQSECSKYKSQCESDETQTTDLAKCPVRCNYKSCHYRSWSSWSATCGDVTRSRRIYYTRNSQKYVKESADCDAYPKTCDQSETQNKTLSICPIRCDYKECNYNAWTSWTMPCGNATRTKKLSSAPNKVIYLYNPSYCDKYAKSCKSTEKEEKSFTPCPKASCKLDLGVILDESGSISTSQFKEETKFIQMLTKPLIIGVENTRVSVISYSDKVRLHFNFKDYQGYNKDGLNQALSKMYRKGGSTNTAGALKTAHEKMFVVENGARPDVSKVLVVITDGRSNTGVTSVKKVADLLKKEYVNIFAVGAGGNVYTSELEAIASDKDHVIKINSINALQSILATMQTAICKEVTCEYKECHYNSWAPWSKTCGETSRTRSLKMAFNRTKTQYGGCSGLLTSCEKTEKEDKKLGECPPHGTPEKECTLDLGAVLDESGSIGSDLNFKKETDFVKDIAKSLTIGPSNTRVSVITFSSSPRLRFKFNDYEGYNDKALYNAMDGLKLKGGGTYTVKALDLARTQMFSKDNGTREDVSKVLLVITDGRSATGVNNIKKASEKLSAQNVNVIAIGVGSAYKPELKALATDDNNIFQVGSLSQLKHAVWSVKKASCKPVQCKYKECNYREWSSWSASCGVAATRTRSLHNATDKVKQRFGGCAGLSQQCLRTQTDTKTLKSCSSFLVTCDYYECSWSAWSQYSATCGKSMVRNRYPIQTKKSSQHIGKCPTSLSTKPCTTIPQNETHSAKCPCRLEKCDWYDWSSWSATCGDVQRTRSLRRYTNYKYDHDCVVLQATEGCKQFGNATETQNVTKNPCLQECKHASCSYTEWSEWSAVCGKINRKRDLETKMMTSWRKSCDGLATECSHENHTLYQEKLQACQCDYVTCEPRQWSSWTTTCGLGERKRFIETVKRVVQDYSCDNLTQSCSESQQVEDRNVLCDCNMVDCVPGVWSAWSNKCGEANRTRDINTAQKTVKRSSCDGLPQTCSDKTEEENRKTLCNCTVAECKWNQWASWSSSCGEASRQRSIKTNMISVAKFSCDGLQTTCTEEPEIDNRTLQCMCNVNTCAWKGWSSWSGTCGTVQRSRVLETSQQTFKGYDCNEVRQENGCKENKTLDFQTLNGEPCTQTCNYVECSYNEWSSWNNDCGLNIKRSQSVQTKSLSKQLVTCDGLLQSCNHMQPQVQESAKLCTCNYTECVRDAWSSWTSECGDATRARSINPVSKSVDKYSCDGLTQSCPLKQETAARKKLCECDYVDCVNGDWSSWSAICGNITRSRNITEMKNQVMKESCDGLSTKCSKTQETEQKAVTCSCNKATCTWNEWSAWSATCGLVYRTRNVNEKNITVNQLSCDGLRQNCNDYKLETDSQATPCPTTKPQHSSPCPYVECVPGQWEEWSSECGAAERMREIIAVKRETYATNCNSLKKECDNEVETQTRNQKCKCQYLECIPGQWSEWSTKCGKGKRTRPINVIEKYVEQYSCHGLNEHCEEENVEHRNELCECKTVECTPAAWSLWSTNCGKGQRERNIVATTKTVKKYSCDGLQTTCPKDEETQDRNEKCTCTYVDCQAGQWTAWSSDCGSVTRSRPINTVVQTVQKYSCDGLQQTCDKAEEVEKRSTNCTCNYVECVPGEWGDWDQSCGKGIERTRLINTIPKTVQQLSCDGLITKCEKTEESETKDELCTCSYVECGMTPWSDWSASCGVVHRHKSVSETPATVKQYSCNGLPTECTQQPQSESKEVKCACDTVECMLSQWTEWSGECGVGNRTRKTINVPKTVERLDCSGLPTQCDEKEEMDTRSKLCDCESVDCVPSSWSQWSTTCGQGKRERSINPVQKIVKKLLCDGLQTTCPKDEETQDRNEKCTCTYVDCQSGQWTAWSSDCGDATRSRPINTVVQTAQKYSCDGLQQTCDKAEDIETRSLKCECQYVECLPGEWSEWSAQCGKDIKRTRPINIIRKTVLQKSCEGLQATCPRNEDTETSDVLCSCSSMQCNWSEWSTWSATCGERSRERKMMGKLITLQQYSCDSLQTTCTQKPESQTDSFIQCPGGIKHDDSNCVIQYRALGCFHDDQNTPRPLPELILTERDTSHRSWNGHLISWKQWDTYHLQFICRCAAKAKELKYTFFSTQFYGECWAGPEAGDTYFRNGESDYKNCIKGGYEQCVPGDQNCIGVQYTNFVYKLD